MEKQTENYVKGTGLSSLVVLDASAHNENTVLSFSKEGFSNLLANVSPLSINEATSRLRTKLLIILVVCLR